MALSEESGFPEITIHSPEIHQLWAGTNPAPHHHHPLLLEVSVSTGTIFIHKSGRMFTYCNFAFHYSPCLLSSIRVTPLVDSFPALQASSLLQDSSSESILYLLAAFPAADPAILKCISSDAFEKSCLCYILQQRENDLPSLGLFSWATRFNTFERTPAIMWGMSIKFIDTLAITLIHCNLFGIIHL